MGLILQIYQFCTNIKRNRAIIGRHVAIMIKLSVLGDLADMLNIF